MINFAEELEKQMKANEVSGAAPEQREYKLAEGIYYMDFRSNKQQQTQKSCFEILENQKKNYVPPKEPVILEADFKEFQKRIDKMRESIEEILQIDDWKEDKDFRDAIEENYAAIDSNYNKQLAILNKFKEIDPCCDMLKKNAREEIEQAIKENKQKQTAFLVDIYGLKPSNSQQMEIEQPKQQQQQQQQKQEKGVEKQQQLEEDNHDEDENDDLLSIQDQLNKQKLGHDNDKKDNKDDEGVFL